MQYFLEKKEKGKIIIRLDQGDLLLESIKDVIHDAGISDGVVLWYWYAQRCCYSHGHHYRLSRCRGFPQMERYANRTL